MKVLHFLYHWPAVVLGGALPLKLQHQKWCQMKALAKLCTLAGHFCFHPSPNISKVIAFLSLQHESAALFHILTRYALKSGDFLHSGGSQGTEIATLGAV